MRIMNYTKKKEERVLLLFITAFIKNSIEIQEDMNKKEIAYCRSACLYLKLK